jgi:hypothetical protein
MDLWRRVSIRFFGVISSQDHPLLSENFASTSNCKKNHAAYHITHIIREVKHYAT